MKTRQMPYEPLPASDLFVLVSEWEHRSRKMFSDAAKTSDEMERRFIEFGAMIYFNCAQELRKNQPKSLLRLILEHFKRDGKRPTSGGLQSSLGLIPDPVIAGCLQKVISCPSDLPNYIASTTPLFTVWMGLTVKQAYINKEINVVNNSCRYRPIGPAHTSNDTAWRHCLKLTKYLKTKIKVALHRMGFGCWTNVV